MCVQIYHELAGLQELRFNWRDKVPPYSVTTSLAGAMQHYPDRDLLLALYHVPQVRLCVKTLKVASSHVLCCVLIARECDIICPGLSNDMYHGEKLDIVYMLNQLYPTSFEPPIPLTD